jgi:hypothetical protein
MGLAEQARPGEKSPRGKEGASSCTTFVNTDIPINQLKEQEEARKKEEEQKKKEAEAEAKVE